MSDENLKEIISGLLRLGYEGTYWDFKEDYTDCREDKLIDIICMVSIPEHFVPMFRRKDTTIPVDTIPAFRC